MSGTSLDGVDAVLAIARSRQLRLVENLHAAYPVRLRRSLLALQQNDGNQLHRSAVLANELADTYAVAVRRLLARAGVAARSVTAIGCHGQTVRHRPREGYTLQLVNGARLAEQSGITVVCDFRNRDIAAGGEGAPLVPAFHQAMFRGRRRNRAVVNVGGIANVTCLPATGKGDWL
jgi:anhydro-N-acetylmuramic acid kinase